MLKKLKSNKGMTMSLSIVIAVVLTAVSLAVSALVATVSINQVDASKKKFNYLTLENAMYSVLCDYYTDSNLKTEIRANGKIDGSSTFKYDETNKVGFIDYVDKLNTEYVVASEYISQDTYKLYIATCSDFEYGDAGKYAMRFKVTFGSVTYDVKEMESTVWSFEF